MEGVGARDMPQGAISSVHFLMTSSYFQVIRRTSSDWPTELPGDWPTEHRQAARHQSERPGRPVRSHYQRCRFARWRRPVPAARLRMCAALSSDRAYLGRPCRHSVLDTACAGRLDNPSDDAVVHPSKANDGTWTYCLRACFGVAADRQALCPATFAKMGCEFVVVRLRVETLWLMRTAWRLLAWQVRIRDWRTTGALFSGRDGSECVHQATGAS